MATRVLFNRREAALVDQRQEQHHRVAGACASAAGEDVHFEAELLDISSFGCRLTGGPTLEPGVRIRLRLPGAAPVEATVSWSRDGEAGCRFVDPIGQGLMRSLLPGAA